jgi:hypothetical protein
MTDGAFIVSMSILAVALFAWGVRQILAEARS